MLKEIQQIVSDQLSAFDNAYRTQLHSTIDIINDINHYLSQRKGKMLRPLMLYLSAGASLGTIPTYKTTMAVALEMLHNSSLIHDDVVDESDRRHNQSTVNHQWSNQIAVLAGDYYLAQVMHLLCQQASPDERDIVSLTAIAMSEGELLQQQTSRQHSVDTNTYLDTIYKKTASLMATCCEIGAYGTTQTDDTGTPLTQVLREYGRLFGMAFQIRDDLMDYMPAAQTGKPCGNDIKERKMTLPLIYFLQEATADARHYIEHLLQYPLISDNDTVEVVNLVGHSNALTRTREAIDHYRQQARHMATLLKPSTFRQGLLMLTDLLAQ